jgi:hypothetical protein
LLQDDSPAAVDPISELYQAKRASYCFSVCSSARPIAEVGLTSSLLVSKSGVVTGLLRSIINASLIAKAFSVGGLEVHNAISPHCPGSFEPGNFTLFLRIAAESKLTTGERQTE